MNANDAVKRILADKGVSQTKLAKILGLTAQSTVSMTLTSEVRCQFVARVGEALGYDLVLRDRETGEEIKIDYDPNFISGRSKR